MNGPLTRQRGQGLVEYVPIVVLVVIIVVVVVRLLGHPIQDAFRQVVNTLQGP
ncbi:MAG TPA: pilus assembly protein [Candidatus Dormibacteraeota bacterium]|nr:pilus assembly protein [Candidatus Dormibacteraeota bacterium]